MKPWCARSPARRAATRTWPCWKQPHRSSASHLRRWQAHLLAEVGKPLDKFGSHLCFLFFGEERGVDGIERDALHAVGVIAPVPGQDQKLVGKRRSEKGWVVGVHRYQYPRVI